MRGGSHLESVLNAELSLRDKGMEERGVLGGVLLAHGALDGDALRVTQNDDPLDAFVGVDPIERFFYFRLGEPLLPF